MAELVYIVGSGRSGSTVIERVLNTASGMTGVGELHALWRLPMTSLLCACGAPVADCTFWQAALGEAGIGPKALRRLAELETSVVRTPYLALLRFDPAGIRADPRLAEFIDLNRRLFAGLQQAAGGGAILDSSKAGPRAWVLQAGLQPLFLHVHRRASDVITSWRRPKHDPSTGGLMRQPSVASAALDWVKAEQAARALSRVARLRRIDHARFALAPRPTLQAALDPEYPGLVDRLPWIDATHLANDAPFHSVLGNPDRFNPGVIHIAPPRTTERPDLPTREARVIRGMGAVLDRFYS